MNEQPGSVVLFAGQKQQELADLRRIGHALAADAIAAVTPATVRDRFELLVQQASAEVEQAPDWPTLALVRARRVTPIKVEALAYLQAALFRAARLDGGVGEVAQRMLAGLTERSGIDRQVLLAVAEAEFTGHTVSMIRLPFPDTTVWRLPVVAHELGHHVARWLRDPTPGAASLLPIDAWLSRRAGTEDERSQLHELFADVYACYVLGATYPVCTVVLAARPDEEFDRRGTHPSWPRRVATMIAALRAMGGTFALAADRRVEPLWHGVSDGRQLSGSQLALVEDQASAMVELLTRFAPARARYSSGGRDEVLVRTLYAIDLPSRPADITIPEVLAAAWRWRLEHHDASEFEFQTVSRNALHWCEGAQP